MDAEYFFFFTHRFFFFPRFACNLRPLGGAFWLAGFPLPDLPCLLFLPVCGLPSLGLITIRVGNSEPLDSTDSNWKSILLSSRLTPITRITTLSPIRYTWRDCSPINIWRSGSKW